MNDLPPMDDVSITLIVLTIVVMASIVLFTIGLTIIINKRFVSKQKVDKFGPPRPRPDPPPMPTHDARKTTINLNQKCTVILASGGVDRLYKMHQQLGVEPSDKYYIGDELSTELWRIMGIFGPGMLHDCDSPIEPDIKLLPHVECPLPTTLIRGSNRYE